MATLVFPYNSPLFTGIAAGLQTTNIQGERSIRYGRKWGAPRARGTGGAQIEQTHREKQKWARAQRPCRKGKAEQHKYSPYAKVLVKTKTTPKNTIFELLYLNHHNIPTIENLVANTQLILEQLGISIY